MSAQPLVIEKTYNAPIAKVWEAITDHTKMKHWYFDLEDFKPEVGFEFEFMAGGPNKKYLHQCKVTEVIPGKKLTYSWLYPEYGGETFVSWELFDEDGKTKLILTHVGLETLPQGTGSFLRESFVQGWTHFTGALGDYIES